MSKIKIIVGPKSYLQSFLNFNFISLEDYVIKTESLIRNIVYKVNEEDYKNLLENKFILAKTESYSAINEEALNNFIHYIQQSIKYGEGIYLQNPPKLIINQIKSSFDCDEYEIFKYQYPKTDLQVLKDINYKTSNQILGQDTSIHRILASMYKLTKTSKKPIVLMFYGPSGVGETEISKIISECLGGKLLRKQMSMNKTNYMFDYIFGNKHGKSSLAKDLLERESNVILLDEFDKGLSEINSAFYQLFDEGIFEDSHYEVDMSNSLIICTANYDEENEIRNDLGDPIYYRFNDLIKFQPLNVNTKEKIVKRIIEKEFNNLSDEERNLLPDSEDLLKKYMKWVEQFTNYRHIEKIIELDINMILVNALIIEY